jgi:hypothetical protein
MRTRLLTVAVPVLMLAAGLGAALAAPASSAAGPASTASVAEGVPAFGHVFLIIGENTTYSHLTMSNAPYLLGTIRPRADSVLRTIEDGFALPGYLGNANDVTPIASIWRAPAGAASYRSSRPRAAGPGAGTRAGAG